MRSVSAVPTTTVASRPVSRYANAASATLVTPLPTSDVAWAAKSRTKSLFAARPRSLPLIGRPPSPSCRPCHGVGGYPDGTPGRPRPSSCLSRPVAWRSEHHRDRNEGEHTQREEQAERHAASVPQRVDARVDPSLVGLPLRRVANFIRGHALPYVVAGVHLQRDLAVQGCELGEQRTTAPDGHQPEERELEHAGASRRRPLHAGSSTRAGPAPPCASAVSACFRRCRLSTP